MLVVENLIKTFKNVKEPTLKGISFEVNCGEVLGLVGKNGAGKSTTIKSITGIYPFESGNIEINGFNIKKNENEAKALMGYVPDNHQVYENLTGREYLNFIADVYGVNKDSRMATIDKYSEMFEIQNALDKQISGYSHGMRQKICLMGALIHDPLLWILDEPFLGLDPYGITQVKKIIKKYAKENKMVLFSSHDIRSVSRVCDKVCVIENGKTRAILDLHDKENRKLLREIMK